MRNYSVLPDNISSEKKSPLLNKSDHKPRQMTDVEMLEVAAKKKIQDSKERDHERLEMLLEEFKKKSAEKDMVGEETEPYDTDRRPSDSCSTVRTIINSPEKAKSKGKNSEYEKEMKYKDESYDIWDLTYTFITGNIPLVLTGLIFFTIILIRYYTLVCLIYIGVESDARHLTWLVVVIGDRFLYFVLVVKISLKTAETKTQLSLKKYWNSQEGDFSEFFQTIDTKKLLTSFLRGIIPAQLSFIYIRANPKKRFQIYLAINFIYCSIEAIVYYPFFIAYTSVLTEDDKFGLNAYYGHSTLALAVLAELCMIVLCSSLLMMGVKRKYKDGCFRCSD